MSEIERKKPARFLTIDEALDKHRIRNERSKALVQKRRCSWVKTLPDNFVSNEMKGLVYLIDCAGHTKVGFTARPIYERIETWACGNPFDFEIFALMPGDLALEHEMHLKFNRFRTKGEWFKLPPDERFDIADLVADRGGVIIERVGNERVA